MQFQKIFSVVLPERVDRKPQLILAANVTGLDIDIQDGVHDEDVESERPPKFPKLAISGHFACAITHIRIWKQYAINLPTVPKTPTDTSIGW